MPPVTSKRDENPFYFDVTALQHDTVQTEFGYAFGLESQE